MGHRNHRQREDCCTKFLISKFVQGIKNSHAETSHDLGKYEEIYWRFKEKCRHMPKMQTHKNKLHQTRNTSKSLVQIEMEEKSEKMANLLMMEDLAEEILLFEKHSQ